MRFERVLWLVLPLALAACPSRTGGLRFDHAAHAERGAACADCHAGGARPSVEACATCHGEAAMGQGPHEPGGTDAAENVTPDEVRAVLGAPAARVEDFGLVFDHARHGEAGVECSTCHAIEGARAKRPAMATCLEACHGADGGLPLTCDSCHKDLRPDGRPTTHTLAWRTSHGPDARASRRTCKTCHDEPSCLRCHETARPADHNQGWRTRTHGVVAAIDRERCAACHRQETCSTCHLKTRPTTHTAAWSSPTTALHCRNCHIPIRTSTCATCHPSFDERHPDAPAWPTNQTHVAGAECRTCHTGTLGGLTHPDNGDDCEDCHAK